MGQIKVVLIFNEDDERQREAGEYLKTKKRCKTALVTELVHAWMKNGKTAVNTVSSTGNVNIEDIKRDAVLTSEPLDLFFAPKYCEIRIVVDTLITFSTTMTIFII